MTRKGLSQDERRAYGARMRAELEAVMNRAFGAMTTDETFWTAVMRTAAVLPDRSPVNAIAITAQCPHATRVLSAGDWRKAGRYPAKGSTSIRIWTPIRRRVGGDAAEEHGDPQSSAADALLDAETRKVSGYKAAPVFDVSQTQGAEYEPPTLRAPLPVAVLRDVLAAQYRATYGEDPARAERCDFDQEVPEVVARALILGHARRRIPEAATLVPGQRQAEAVSAAHVAARMLGITPLPAVMPALAGVVVDGRRPPVHESAVRAIETGRAIADAVTAAAQELIGTV
jgi:hypothetical protein